MVEVFILKNNYASNQHIIISNHVSYSGQQNHDVYRTVKKIEVQDKTREILRDHLVLDYDLYSFIASRFYHQLSQVRESARIQSRHHDLSNDSKLKQVIGAAKASSKYKDLFNDHNMGEILQELKANPRHQDILQLLEAH